MAKLPKFTLSKNERTDRWDLKNDSSNRTVKSFERKADATREALYRRRSVPEVGP
jgi:hypothetical protein